MNRYSINRVFHRQILIAETFVSTITSVALSRLDQAASVLLTEADSAHSELQEACQTDASSPSVKLAEVIPTSVGSAS